MFRKNPKPEPLDENYVIINVLIKLSKEFVHDLGRGVSTLFKQRSVTFFAGLIVGFGGTAGVDNWLQQQPETPAVPTNEATCPRE